jgi:hypothetical protein
MTIDELKRYIDRPRHFDEVLFGRIVQFLEKNIGLNICWPVFRNWNYGSCYTFRFSLDSNAEFLIRPIENVDHIKSHIAISISARGPLITSHSYCIQSGALANDEGNIKPDTSNENVLADKAKEIADQIASEFGFLYIDLKWLHSILLDEESLSEDAFISVDHSDFTALSVLFSEEL